MKTQPNFRQRNEQQSEDDTGHRGAFQASACSPPDGQASEHVGGAFLTPGQVAALMQVDIRTVYAAIRSGRLPALNWGSGSRSCYRVSSDSLGALSDSDTVSASVMEIQR